MDAALLALNKDEDTISVIDPETGDTTELIETDYNPHEIVVTDDQRYSYVTCSIGNTVNVIDNDTFEIVDRITHPEFAFPHGMDITPDGEDIYLASTRSSRIFIIDVSSNEIRNVIPTEQEASHMVTITPDGTTAYIANIGSDNVTVLDIESEEIREHIPVGGSPEGIAVHPNGEHLYVANQDDDDVYVIDTETHERLYKRDLGTNPFRIVFSPDGRYALIPNRVSGELSIVDTEYPLTRPNRQSPTMEQVGMDHELEYDTGPWEMKRLRLGVWPGGTVFDADGSYAYVCNLKENDISVIDMESLKEVDRYDAGVHPDGIGYVTL